MSALPPEADIRQRIEQVCFVPQPDNSAGTVKACEKRRAVVEVKKDVQKGPQFSWAPLLTYRRAVWIGLALGYEQEIICCQPSEVLYYHFVVGIEGDDAVASHQCIGPYRSRPCTRKSRLVSSGWSMSALPPKADIRQRIEHVCFVP
jgi:hypothetical protein